MRQRTFDAPDRSQNRRQTRRQNRSQTRRQNRRSGYLFWIQRTERAIVPV